MANPTEVATSQEPLSDEDVVARVLAGETGMFEIIMRRHNQTTSGKRRSSIFCSFALRIVF
jgi:non-ribosomal peptide synthetase component E (peptide arylation enzyme)